MPRGLRYNGQFGGNLRIAVSGAAGFIGSHMCDRLLAEGHTVVALDNFLTGSPGNLAHLEGHTRFRFVEQDITKPFAVDGAVDGVVNMASPASPKDYLEHPIETLDVGSIGTRRMLELALEKDARFLITSTSECYGDPLIHPQVETYWDNVNPVGPRSCYDENKRFSEALTMAYHRKHGLRTNIARIFNTYGPRMKLNDGRVVPAFLDRALRPAHDGLRRGLADAQFLLRQRPGGRPQPREPHRVDDSPVRGTHSPYNRNRIRNRIRAPARGRPPAARAGHRQSPRGARMGAAHSTRRRPAPHGRVFPRHSRQGGVARRGVKLCELLYSTKRGMHPGGRPQSLGSRNRDSPPASAVVNREWTGLRPGVL